MQLAYMQTRLYASTFTVPATPQTRLKAPKKKKKIFDVPAWLLGVIPRSRSSVREAFGSLS